MIGQRHCAIRVPQLQLDLRIRCILVGTRSSHRYEQGRAIKSWNACQNDFQVPYWLQQFQGHLPWAIVAFKDANQQGSYFGTLGQLPSRWRAASY